MALTAPASWLAVAFGSVLVVVVASVWLLWPRKGRTEAHQLLGRPLLTGAIVGLGLVPAQIGLQLELRRHDAQVASTQRQQAARLEFVASLNLCTDLRDIDLHQSDLRGLYLARRDFANANFRRARLVGANLVGANLSGANLEGAYLEGADLTDQT
jgi:uncharacterized protein YjbI with pentapeptide repeats